MEGWIVAVIGIGVSIIIAGAGAAGGIMWRQGKSEGKLCAEIKMLKDAFHSYAEKNDQLVITCTKAIGENAEDIAYLKGRQNGKQN